MIVIQFLTFWETNFLTIIKTFKIIGPDVIKDIGIKMDFERSFGEVNILLINNHDLNIEIRNFLAQYSDYI